MAMLPILITMSHLRLLQAHKHWANAGFIHLPHRLTAHLVHMLSLHLSQLHLNQCQSRHRVQRKVLQVWILQVVQHGEVGVFEEWELGVAGTQSRS